jgi:repressor LexA
VRRDPDDLTERTREVLAALERLLARDGFPPTLRELAGEVGLRSPSSALHHVEVLEAAELIERRPACPRAVRLVDRVDAGRTVLGEGDTGGAGGADR